MIIKLIQTKLKKEKKMKNEERVVDIQVIGPPNTGKVAMAMSLAAVLKKHNIPIINEEDVLRHVIGFNPDEVLTGLRDAGVSVRIRVLDEFKHNN